MSPPFWASLPPSTSFQPSALSQSPNLSSLSLAVLHALVYMFPGCALQGASVLVVLVCMSMCVCVCTHTCSGKAQRTRCFVLLCGTLQVQISSRQNQFMQSWSLRILSDLQNSWSGQDLNIGRISLPALSTRFSLQTDFLHKVKNTQHVAPELNLS